jgi:dethiobiotin synthetase
MTRALFVTGTDTEVGKTVVTRALVRALVNRGLTVRAVKPVESGAPTVNGQLRPKDALALKGAAKRNGDVKSIYAYAFPDPVSPHLAARHVGEEIEIEPILALIDAPEQGADVIVAEGAGGLLAPLSDDLLYADLVAKAGLELVIVSPNMLGTINHTLLTIEAAKSRDIPIVGVILNRTPEGVFGNAQAISKYGEVTIIGEFPTANTADDDHLADLAEQHIDLDKLL